MTNLLILTPQLPYPPQQGTSLRNFHIIRGVAQAHSVTLLSFLETGQTAVSDQIAPLAELCEQIVTAPVPPRSAQQRLVQLAATRRPDMAHRLYSPLFEEKLRQLLGERPFDIVQVEGIELARYITTIRTASPSSRIVFDDHNAEAELQRRNMLTDVRQPRRWAAAGYSWFQVQRLRHFERWAMQTADATVAVSETDRQLLEELFYGAPVTPADHRILNTEYRSPITVIPNCIDTQQFATYDGPSLPFDLVFSGKMDYRPNVDAVLWFADAVWPVIKQARPSTTWAIVGQKPHSRLARLGQLDGVTVTGWVESVRPYLGGAKVTIMPFRVGSGTRLKLIESMAAGKAIVSTRIGAEGFPVTAGQELLLADGAEEMSTAVLRLLDHPEERQRLGQNAQQFAQQYDWRLVIPRFDDIYAALLTR